MQYLRICEVINTDEKVLLYNYNTIKSKINKWLCVFDRLILFCICFALTNSKIWIISSTTQCKPQNTEAQVPIIKFVANRIFVTWNDRISFHTWYFYFFCYFGLVSYLVGNNSGNLGPGKFKKVFNRNKSRDITLDVDSHTFG
jgi:hypothetical protein